MSWVAGRLRREGHHALNFLDLHLLGPHSSSSLWNATGLFSAAGSPLWPISTLIRSPFVSTKLNFGCRI